MLDGTSLYSPFVSTTSNLMKFVNETLSPITGAGDINIRHDVFNVAPKIGVFAVPKRYCVDGSAELSNREGEVCVDTNAVRKEMMNKELHPRTFPGSLSSDLSNNGCVMKFYKMKDYDNPFKGNINVNLERYCLGSMYSEDMDRLKRIHTELQTYRNNDKICDDKFAILTLKAERLVEEIVHKNNAIKDLDLIIKRWSPKVTGVVGEMIAAFEQQRSSAKTRNDSTQNLQKNVNFNDQKNGSVEVLSQLG